MMADIRKKICPDGRIKYQVRFKSHTTDSGYGYKSFSRAKTAKTFELKKTLEEEEMGSTVPNLLITNKRFSDAANHWLNACESTGVKGREPVEKSTLRKYNLHVKILSEVCDDSLLTTLTSSECDKIRDKLLKKYSRKYAKKILASFKTVLSHARHIQFMNHDPAESTLISISQRASKKDVTLIPTMEEVSVLLSTSKENQIHPNKTIRNAWKRYTPFIETIIFSGMRPCEVLGLPWKNVNFANNTITVSQDATEDLEIGLPKSGAAYRKIPMPEIVMYELLNWKEVCPESAYDLVFPNSLGNVESHANISNRAWYPLLKQCGFVTQEGKTKYVLTSLRHVRASLEIHHQASAKEIQELMGHSSIKITYDVYGHLFKDHENERSSRANLIADQLYKNK